MAPPQRQRVARISEEGRAVAGSAADNFQGGPGDQTAGLNATERIAYGRERGLYPEQVDRWRRAFLSDGDGKDRLKGNPRLVFHRQQISAAAALEDVLYQIKLLG